MRYAIVIENAGGNYSAYVPDLPGCVATGATIESVESEIREAIRLHVDGLELKDAYVAAAVRCAPPDNKPTTEERDTCLPYLRRELALLPDVQVIVVLGQFAYDVMVRELGIRPKAKFGHGVEVPVPDTERTIVCSFHPSQQNTFTGKLTEEMFDAIFQRTRALTSPIR